MIINRQIGGSGGEAASIFITGLSETDTVTCTKDGKTKQGKWVNKTNPAVSVPVEYTQLEYIESSGTQYINTDVSAPNGFKAILDWMFTDFSGDNNKTVLGSEDSASPWACNWLQKCGESAYTWHLGAYSEYLSSTAVSVNTQYDIDMSTIKGASYLKIDGDSIITDTNSNSRSSNSIYIFGTNKAGTAGDPSSARLYSCKIIKDDETVRNYIPAKRNSDGAIGMYDLVSKSFFTNAGTGTFTAGAELPSVISGWLFDKLKEYGIYTITATNGTNTTTQDVLVDMAIEFDIEMSYIKDRLLTSDDFQNGIFKNGTHSILTNQENGTDGIRLVGAASRLYNNPSLDAFIRLDMTIDFTGYSKLKFKMKKVVDHGIMLVVITDGLKNTSKSWDVALGYDLQSTYTEPFTVAYVGITKRYGELTANVWNDYEIDISNVTGEHVLSFVGGYTDSSGYSTSETHYCDIWLMK